MGVSILTIPGSALAAKDLLNELGKKVSKLDADKNFEKKKLLMMVGQEKKTTTVGKFLSTVQSNLSDTQYHLFTLPLVMISSQQMPVATVRVGGTIISNLGVGNVVPTGLEGVADLYLLYEGDLALPGQVLGNLGKEEK
ncbi:MAG TPA: hypothetical protein DF383_05090 [Deltaproteobacteria bacterium]|nr:hypothetical protein [Deltaproteobacteria bacterium]